MKQQQIQPHQTIRVNGTEKQYKNLEKECYCGKKFIGTRPWSKYCSKKCTNSSPMRRKNTRDFQAGRRGRINEIKMKLGCSICGYNKHPAALDFDHIDPALKSFTLSQDPKRAWSKIEAEIKKCRVLCANCHRIETVKHGHTLTRR